MLQKFFLWAGSYHLTSAYAGTGTDVDHIVGAEYHIAVVLHNDDRIAEVAQLFQCVD